MKFQNFSIAKIEFLWRALNFKRGHGPPGPPFPPPMGLWQLRSKIAINCYEKLNSCSAMLIMLRSLVAD